MARRLIDLADVPPTHRLCVLPWRVFGQFPEEQKTTIVAVAAALAAVQGVEQKGTTTAAAVGVMVGKNERQVRDAFSALSRAALWTRGNRVKRAYEWWVNVGQMTLFGDSHPATGAGSEAAAESQPATGAGSELAQPATGAGREIGTIRNITKSINNDDGKRVTGKDAPLDHPDAVSSSSSFLQKEIGMGEADADEIASLRSLEWVAEWLSVIPYYRKKPIENVPGFLLRAAREGWKPPRVYLARRDADRIAEARRALEHDELRARRPADPVTVEAERAAALEKMRAAGAALREQFAKRRATA